MDAKERVAVTSAITFLNLIGTVMGPGRVGVCMLDEPECASEFEVLKPILLEAQKIKAKRRGCETCRGRLNIRFSNQTHVSYDQEKFVMNIFLKRRGAWDAKQTAICVLAASAAAILVAQCMKKNESHFADGDDRRRRHYV